MYVHVYRAICELLMQNGGKTMELMMLDCLVVTDM